MPLLVVVLICAVSVTPDRCTDRTAISVATRPTSSQLSCLMEGQQIAAGSLAETIEDGAYVRIDCRRRKAG